MVFDGNNITFTTVNGRLQATSKIPFGRAFNYTDLTDMTSSDFYLYKFVYSNNATVDIEATKSVDENGLMTYEVHYTLTSETNAVKHYYHLLEEKDFFDDGTVYATIYADGATVTTTEPLNEADKVKYLYAGTLNYDIDEDTYIPNDPDDGTGTWSLTDDMYSHIQFNRGYNPQYRIKYVLTNFYTLGTNVVYGATEQTLNNGATVNITYAGLTVTVSDVEVK